MIRSLPLMTRLIGISSFLLGNDAALEETVQSRVRIDESSMHNRKKHGRDERPSAERKPKLAVFDVPTNRKGRGFVSPGLTEYGVGIYP